MGAPREEPRHPGGRPKQDHSLTEPLSTKVPREEYDLTDRLARKQGVTLSEFIRRAIRAYRSHLQQAL